MTKDELARKTLPGIPEVIPKDGIGFIAEIGANHNGDMSLAKTMIREAKNAGATAVKFQSWSLNTLVSEEEYENNPQYADTHRHFGSLKDMVKAYWLSPEQHVELSNYCFDLGIAFMSSIFCKDEAELLHSIGVQWQKIASCDVSTPEVLEAVGNTGDPVMLSTGMHTMAEIDQAVSILKGTKTPEILLLHCVSVYPPRLDTLNLHNIQTLHSRYGTRVGFSDHTQSGFAAATAVALGACVIEKHFTLDREMEGWDHWLSAVPDDFAEMVAVCKEAHASLGSRRRVISDEEWKKGQLFRRSLCPAVDAVAGTMIPVSDLVSLRSGRGISPMDRGRLCGKRYARDVRAGHVLHVEDIEL